MSDSPIFALAAVMWRQMNEDYQEAVEADFAQASEAIGGAMVNAAGRREGVDEHSLFHGPMNRAARYASEELMEWWATVQPRRTRREFEEQWLLGRGGFG